MGFGVWGMGYGCKFPANQLAIGSSKNVWPMREYGLYLVCVRRESTVCDVFFVWVAMVSWINLLTTWLFRSRIKETALRGRVERSNAAPLTPSIPHPGATLYPTNHCFPKVAHAIKEYKYTWDFGSNLNTRVLVLTKSVASVSVVVIVRFVQSVRAVQHTIGAEWNQDCIPCF